ncbi:MAG TPA: zinc dependent phospholipase C family protein [Candidatus Angelobacter sp.]|nr:zinc dependent phospholipase C family protein [Candidatus Angelobacter sp.]
MSTRHRSTLASLFGSLILVLFMGMSWPHDCAAYSVLTHEAIIDAAWRYDIKPLLLRRFPNATPEELIEAHAYVYGGAIIQDMGYYPFGSQFFSDLTHYVRSGDFVLALIEESKDLNEYAFALGALAHYAADKSGHEFATNRAVAIMYPKLAKKYGPVVTYQEKPSAHMKVEYGFDVDQVAEGNYAPKAYHDFVGFEVSKPVLERAFAKTYSLDMSSVFFSVDMAIGSYRHAVSTVIPRMTKVAWHLKRDEIQNSHPNETKKQFIYNISSSGYRKEWGHVYETPGFGARLKAFFLRLVPKVGPFSGLAFHPPTPAVEQLYMSSFNQTLDQYRALLLAQQEQRLQLPNDNLDTGAVTGAATYRLADETYAKLLDKTSGKPISEALRQDFLSYYADLEKPYATKRDSKAWHELIKEVDRLKSTHADGIALPEESPSVSALVIQESQRGAAKTGEAETDRNNSKD